MVDPGDFVKNPSEWNWSSYNATVGTYVCPSFLKIRFILDQFSLSRSIARALYKDFVLAGIGMESPFEKVKNQLFLGSDSFVEEVREKACFSDELQNVPGVQKFAGSPKLTDLFDGNTLVSSKTRNKRIKEAFDRYGYTLREIGDHLDLHPNYISSLLGKMRKT